MKSILKKELRTYFTGSVVYACYALMFLISGIYTWAVNIQSLSGNFEITVTYMAFWLCILPVPLITMRVFAEERRQKTDKLLYSLPVGSSGIVLGKFFAAAVIMLIPLVIIGINPIVLSFFGNVNLASSYSVLFGFYLLSLALIAVGLFVSSMTENQIVAAIVTAVLIFVNYYLPGISNSAAKSAISNTVFLIVIAIAIGFIVWFLTKNIIVGTLTAVLLNFALILVYFLKADLLDSIMTKAIEASSLFAALDTFAGGVFDLTNVLLYMSVAAVFLFLTVQSLEKRRWE